MLLSKTHRLNLKSVSSREVFMGKKWNSENFSANHDFKGDKDHALINIVVGKKQFKLATHRVKAKRKIWANLPTEFKNIKNLRLVFRPKKEILKANHRNLIEELLILLNKITNV